MSYAAIITHVRAEPEAAPRLAAAIALARRFRARLIGIGVEMIPPLTFDGGYYSVDAEWIAAMRENIEEQLGLARDLFKRETAAFAERDTTWLSGIDAPTPAVAAASRAADLIVAGGARDHLSPYRDVSVAELTIQAGRPVLVVPSAGPALSARKILLGWKDTREARRALSDSLPFLEAAEAVRVLEVGEGDSLEDARIRTEDVVAALARRGVRAEAKQIPHSGAPAGQRLYEEAAIFGADLIVLGCYGHSRLGEWVFGGATRDLLSQDEIHLLLSH
jgi:nucleotide-binding universal stress UspA family protein